MLRRLLRLVGEEDGAQVAALARALGVSPRQVGQMIAELEAHSYLEALVGGEQPCERCPRRAACLYRSRARVWILTRKGERIAAQGAVGAGAHPEHRYGGPQPRPKA